MGLHCRKMVATINTLKHYLCQCKSMVGTINTLKHVKYYIIIALSPKDGRMKKMVVTINTLKHYLGQCKSLVGTINTLKQRNPSKFLVVLPLMV